MNFSFQTASSFTLYWLNTVKFFFSCRRLPFDVSLYAKRQTSGKEKYYGIQAIKSKRTCCLKNVKKRYQQKYVEFSIV
jgi:hypothetical protein